MQSISEELKGLNTEVVVISADSVEDNARLAKKKRFDFHLLADPELTAIDLFGVRHQGASIDGGDIARPAVFLADDSGQIRWTWMTANWRIRVRPEMVLDQVRGL